jgi:hypothetical protein
MAVMVWDQTVRGFKAYAFGVMPANRQRPITAPEGVTGETHGLLNCIQYASERSFLAVLPEFYAGAKSPVVEWINLLILRKFMVNPRGVGKAL